MTLPAGTRIGTYEIVALIGAGGMGEVYRARDAKLRRDVAIKLLPPAAGTTAEALARFEREAHAVAALSHPNILAIFDFGTHDGSPFAVMELLDGVTLRERLAEGALPRREALDYAVQIAKGLAVAHEKGIVHRDLKPENIFITADRRAKILDFGLAKQDARIPIGSDTETQKLHTEPGVVLGTTAYMSPEQARGAEIDSRSDIFSFGAVLSEMLTGRRVFARDSAAETLTAILKEDPPDLSASVAPPLARIIERCLQKRPADRFQSARDLAFALEALSDSQTTQTTSATAPVRSARVRPSLIAAAIAIAVIASTATWLLRRRSPPPPIRMLQASVPDLRASFDEIPEISPDGTRLAYFRGTALHVERLDTPETIDISLPPGETVRGVYRSFFWSPDGASLAFGAANKLWRVAATGGTPSLLCDIPESGSILGGSWGNADSIVFSVWQGSLYRVPASGGRPEKILAADPAREVDFHSPYVLPDGSILFIPHRHSGISTVELLSGGKISTVLQMPGFVLSRVQFDPAGFLLLDQRNADGIWAVPFSLRTLRTTGAPYLALREGSSPTVSRDGSLVFLRGAVAPAGELVNVTPDGTVTSAAAATRDPIDPAIAPDGQRVAISQLENGRRDIWIYDLARQTRTRLSRSGASAAAPVWAAGGNRIVYVDLSAGGGTIKSAAAAGEGGEQLLPAANIGRVDVSHDGKWLAYATDDGSGRGTIYVAPLDASGRPAAPPRRLEGTSTTGWRISIAPQADLIAYASQETDDPEMDVHTFPGGTAKWQVSTTGGISAAWNRTGDRLYYTTATDMMEVEARRTPSLTFGAPRRLFALTERHLRPNAGFDIGPDGRFLMVRDTGEPVTMVVAINGERLLRQPAR